MARRCSALGGCAWALGALALAQLLYLSLLGGPRGPPAPGAAAPPRGRRRPPPPPPRGRLDVSGAFRIYRDLLAPSAPGCPETPEVVLATHGTPERVAGALGSLAGLWGGPLSVAVLAAGPGGPGRLGGLLGALGGCRELRGRLRVHAVTAAGAPRPERPGVLGGGCRRGLARVAGAPAPPNYALGPETPYPGNLLRNVARGGAGGGPGRFVLLLDADVVPSRGLREALVAMLRRGGPPALGAGGVPGGPEALGDPKAVGGVLGDPNVLRDTNALGAGGVLGDPNALGAGGVLGDPNALGAGGVLEEPNALRVSNVLGAGGVLGDPNALGAGGVLGDPNVLRDPNALGAGGVLGDPNALGAGGVLGDPNALRVSNALGAGGVLGVPNGLGIPNALGAVGAGGVPKALGAPDALVAPHDPGVPDTLDVPDAPGVPNDPGVLHVLDVPNVPNAPGAPNDPGLLHVPDVPEAPGAPDPLDVPNTLGVPDTPAVTPGGPWAAWARVALVLPAFEVPAGTPVPGTKEELGRLWGAGVARPFYGALCPRCQAPTGYGRWLALPPAPRLGVAYVAPWRDPWEPFYVAPADGVPPFDERFQQYGFNRISQACELHVAGFSFAVLDGAFVVHRGVKAPGGFHGGREAELRRNRRLFRRFKEELRGRYPGSPRRC
ncbi:beta-1,4-glucuronyltransferase 1 [Dromaius novaehollandiae]|uniref:beta-1,4-glucuronyltransferase 1 n=1 Tax=Dromaius novaehollandiae TaxID=8790 RepID=UPI00311E50EC